MRHVISVLRLVDNLFGQISRVITAVAIGLQMVIMFIGVIFRYFFNSSLTWSDELSTYLLVFVTFFGSYIALKDKALAKIELLIDNLPAMPRKIVVFIANLCVFTLLVAVAYFGTKLVTSPVILKQKTPAMELPMVWFYALIPLTAAMMVINTLVSIHDGLNERREGK